MCVHFFKFTSIAWGGFDAPQAIEVTFDTLEKIENLMLSIPFLE